MLVVHPLWSLLHNQPLHQKDKTPCLKISELGLKGQSGEGTALQQFRPIRRPP